MSSYSISSVQNIIMQHYTGKGSVSYKLQTGEYHERVIHSKVIIIRSVRDMFVNVLACDDFYLLF